MALDFQLSEEHLALQTAMDQLIAPFLQDEEALRKRIHVDKDFPPELWEAISDSGLMGALVPEEYGGNGMGMLSLVLGYECLGKKGINNALMLLTAMAVCCILREGSEEQKQRFLPKMAAGKLTCCFALTEPDAGSNAFRLRTLARRDGDSYVVNGQKVFITGADKSDLMLLICRTTSREEIDRAGLPKALGLAALIVDPKAPGITMHPIPTRGIEGMTQWMIHLDDVRVPVENLIGKPDHGASALFNTLNPERILVAATGLGVAQYCLAKAVDYAKSRRVFGNRPIAEYQAISHPLAEVYCQLESVRLLTYRAAWSFDRNDPPQVTGAYANQAKYLGSEMALHAVDRAIQTHGGYGFSEEYGLIYYWDSMRLFKTAPVSNEMVLNFIAEHQLGLPKSY